MTGLGQSCGACKFLRRKCTSECVFAPYFCYDGAASHFAAVHKVFGASNVSKLLLHLPIHNRGDAATTISFEALARMRDPIYGCVAHIFALQQQVAYLQEEIGILGNQIASNFTLGVESSESSEATNTSHYCNSNLEPQVIIPQLDVTNNNNNNISQSQIMMLSSSSSSSSSENSNYMSADFNGQALFDDNILQLSSFIGLEEENNIDDNVMICTDDHDQSLFLEPLGLELEGLFYEIEQVNFGNTLWLEDINNSINVPNCVPPIWD